MDSASGLADQTYSILDSLSLLEHFPHSRHGISMETAIAVRSNEVG